MMWMLRIQKRHGYNPNGPDFDVSTPQPKRSSTKQPREAPEPTSRRYAEWVEAKRNRELWEKTLLPAFNRYAGTSLTLDAGTMAAVRDWVKANENRLIEADLARAVR